MSSEQDLREALIKAEVDCAMAPYAKAPAFLRSEMRQKAEQYFRENPHAVRALDMLVAKRIRDTSGETTIGGEGTARDEQKDKGGS